MTNIVRPMTYVDPIVHNRLRVYADDRGFAQLSMARSDDRLGVEGISVRIRDEALDELIEILTIARDNTKENDMNDAQNIRLAALDRAITLHCSHSALSREADEVVSTAEKLAAFIEAGDTSSEE